MSEILLKWLVFVAGILLSTKDIKSLNRNWGFFFRTCLFAFHFVLFVVMELKANCEQNWVAISVVVGDALCKPGFKRLHCECNKKGSFSLQECSVFIVWCWHCWCYVHYGVLICVLSTFIQFKWKNSSTILNVYLEPMRGEISISCKPLHIISCAFVFLSVSKLCLFDCQTWF